MHMYMQGEPARWTLRARHNTSAWPCHDGLAIQACKEKHTHLMRGLNLTTCMQVEVYEDAMYGTPVFKTISGMTSCPRENNTLAREGFSVVPGPTVFNAVPTGSMQPVRIDLINTSETDEDVSLKVRCTPCRHLHHGQVHRRLTGLSRMLRV